MTKLLKEILNYLSNSTQEQLERDWQALESYSKVGPIATKFAQQSLENYQYSLRSIKTTNVVNNTENPEYSFGFFINKTMVYEECCI